MKFNKSIKYYIIFLVFWWCLWLIASKTEINEFNSPSTKIITHYILLIVSFIIGSFTVRLFWEINKNSNNKIINIEIFDKYYIEKFIILILCVILSIILLYGMYRANAFADSFTEYHMKLRRIGLNYYLTGLKPLDLFIKLIGYPFSYSIFVYSLAKSIKNNKGIITLSVMNMLLYSYLWQVNYPIIHMFWILIIINIITFNKYKTVNKKFVVICLLMFILLICSSLNRFGGNIKGALFRYFIGYHLAGFSFYGYHIENCESILHVCSFGRSTIGYIDQTIDILLRIIGSSYTSASLENANYNMIPVELGSSHERLVNAFGTILFSFYRDLGLCGIIIGGILYGASVTYNLIYITKNWLNQAFFLILASSWLLGMMVSPVEQSYFWFSIIFLKIINIFEKINLDVIDVK